MKKRLVRIQGVVIKSEVLKEADLLVSLITSDGAKVRAMAYGARKLTSKKMGHLEPLTRVDMVLYRGKNLYTINQVQGLEVFETLKKDLESTTRGIYLAEMVEGFANEGSEDPELYMIFLDTLKFLNDYPLMYVVIPFFQLQLLKVTGFMPQLYNCVGCRSTILDTNIRFNPELGGVLCHDCTPENTRIYPVSVQSMKLLRFFDSHGIHELKSLNVNELLLRELGDLLDGMIGSCLDRRIKSKGFLDLLQEQRTMSIIEQ